MHLITRTLLLLVMVGVASMPASAQQLRIGYVDMKQVLDNAPQVLAGREVLDREFRPRNEAIEAEEEQLGRMEQRLARGDLEENARLTLEREIREARRGITVSAKTCGTRSRFVAPRRSNGSRTRSTWPCRTSPVPMVMT